MIVGLTAPFQHGKTELEPVIKSAGWKFLDLNNIQNGLRIPGTERRRMYEDHIPGCLDDEGGETLQYYMHVTAGMRQELLPAEIPIVAAIAEQRIQSASPGENIIMSWELLPHILGKLSLDHVIVFSQPRERWFQRLRSRIIERGWESWLPGDAEIIQLIETMNAVPERIIQSVRQQKPTAHTIFDVSPDDWGAADLVKLLGTLS